MSLEVLKYLRLLQFYFVKEKNRATFNFIERNRNQFSNRFNCIKIAYAMHRRNFKKEKSFSWEFLENILKCLDFKPFHKTYCKSKILNKKFIIYEYQYIYLYFVFWRQTQINVLTEGFQTKVVQSFSCQDRFWLTCTLIIDILLIGCCKIFSLLW